MWSNACLSLNGFAYRSSVFQQQDLVCWNFTGCFLYAENNWLKYRGQRKAPAPVLPSCGSTFRNPPGTYAGKVIEELGLKGTQIGQAQISPSHANFIVNLGGASAQDVFGLIKLIKQEAAARGITMETEVRLWGQFE